MGMTVMASDDLADEEWVETQHGRTHGGRVDDHGLVILNPMHELRLPAERYEAMVRECSQLRRTASLAA